MNLIKHVSQFKSEKSIITVFTLIVALQIRYVTTFY